MTGYVAIDQYGHTLPIRRHPRKELCEQLGAKTAHRLYWDRPDGSAEHVGYVIGGLWLRVYRLAPFKEAAK
jgi:hypothetical protein